MEPTEEEYLKFLKCCEKNLTGSNKELISLIKKRYNECNKKYKNSEELRHLLSATRKKMRGDNKNLFVHLKECLNELKAYSTDGKGVKRKQTSDNESDANCSKKSKLSNGKNATTTDTASRVIIDDSDNGGKQSEVNPPRKLGEKLKITETAASRTTSSLASVINNLKEKNILGKSETDQQIHEKVVCDKKEQEPDDDEDDDDDCILIEDTEPIVYINLDDDDDDDDDNTKLETNGLTSDKTKSEEKEEREEVTVNNIEKDVVETKQDKDVDDKDAVSVNVLKEDKDEEISIKEKKDIKAQELDEVKVQDDDDIFDQEMELEDTEVTEVKEVNSSEVIDEGKVQSEKNEDIKSDNDQKNSKGFEGKEKDITEKKETLEVEVKRLSQPEEVDVNKEKCESISRDHLHEDPDKKKISTSATKDSSKVSEKASPVESVKEGRRTDTSDISDNVQGKVDGSNDLITMENSVQPSQNSVIILDTSTDADLLTSPEVSSKEFFAKALNLSGVGLTPKADVNVPSRRIDLQPASTSASTSHGTKSPSSRSPRRSSTSGGDREESKESKKKEVSSKHIHRLERLLEKLRDKIDKIQEKELSLDDLDEEDSSYIYEDKLKKKFVAVWNKLCELKERAPTTGRPTERRFSYQGTRYPEINKKIEKLINRKKIFPDFHDIKRLITKVNTSHKLHLSKPSIESLSREAFTDVGNMLQRRRHEDFVTTFGCTMTDKTDDGTDPAQFDSQLREKLEENRTEGKAKLDQVIKKFSDLQYSHGEVGEEVPEGSDAEKSGEEEEDEEEEEDNDVITVTVEDLSSDNEDILEMKSFKHSKRSSYSPLASGSFPRPDSPDTIRPRPISTQDSPNIIKPRPIMRGDPLRTTDPVLIDDSESPERELSLEADSPAAVCIDSPVVIASESPLNCQASTKPLETSLLDDTSPQVPNVLSSTLDSEDLSKVDISAVDDPPEPVEVEQVGEELLSSDDPSLPVLSTPDVVQEQLETSTSTPNATSTPVATESGHSSPSQDINTKPKEPLTPSVQDSSESSKDLSKSDNVSHKRIKWLAPLDGESFEDWQKSDSDVQEKTQTLSPVVSVSQKGLDNLSPSQTERTSGSKQHLSPHKSPSIEIVEDTPESTPSKADIPITMATPPKGACRSPIPSSEDPNTSSPLTIQPRYAARESSPSCIEIVDSVLSSDEDCTMEDDVMVTWTKHSHDKSPSSVDPEVLRRSIFLPSNQEKTPTPERFRTNTCVSGKGGNKSLSLNRSPSSTVQYSQTQNPSVSSTISSSYQAFQNKKPSPVKNYTVSRNLGNQSLSRNNSMSNLNYKVHNRKESSSKVMFLDHRQLNQQNRNHPTQQKTSSQGRTQSSYLQNSPNRRATPQNHQLIPQKGRNFSQNHQLSPQNRRDAAQYKNLSPQLRRDLAQLKQTSPQNKQDFNAHKQTSAQGRAHTQHRGAMQRISFSSSPQKTMINRASLQRQHNNQAQGYSSGKYVSNRSSFGPTGQRSLNGRTSNKSDLLPNAGMVSGNQTNLHPNRNQHSRPRPSNNWTGGSPTKQAAQNNNFSSFSGQSKNSNVSRQGSRSPAAGQGHQFKQVHQTLNQRPRSAAGIYTSDQHSRSLQGTKQMSPGSSRLYGQMQQSVMKQRSPGGGNGQQSQYMSNPQTNVTHRSRSPGMAQLSPGSQGSRLPVSARISPGNQRSRSPGSSSLQLSPGRPTSFSMKQTSCSPGTAGYQLSPGGQTTLGVKQRSRSPTLSKGQPEGQMSAVKQAVEMSSQCYIDIDEGDECGNDGDGSGDYGEGTDSYYNEGYGQEEYGLDEGKGEDVVVLSDSD